MKTFLILLALGLTCLALENAGDTLRKLQVVFRHGYRYPDNLKWTTNDTCAMSYKANLTMLGNLTDLGRNQMSLLGSFLKVHYYKIIGSDPAAVQVNYSDNYYRDQESGQLVSDALFGKNAQKIALFNKTIEGQPDVSGYDAWMKSVPFSKKLQDQCTRLENITKQSCKNHSDLSDFSDQLFSELAERCTLPSWMTAEDQENLMAEYNISYGPKYSLCSNRQYVQNNADNMFKWINEVFKSNNLTMYKNVSLYASHDVNIALYLQRMGVFNFQIVPFGAALFFEQHLIDNQMVIRIFYNNHTDYTNFHQLKLPGCDYDCPFDSFVKIVTGPYDCSFASRPNALSPMIIMILFIAIWLFY